MSTIPVVEANFIPVRVNDRYLVRMPRFLAERGAWSNWEPERFASIESVLKQGDVLFDVGAETGEISAIYAQFVGAENMVLFEPNPDNWQNIKATWDANNLQRPRATICALVGTLNTTHGNFDTGHREGWPVVALTGRIWTPRSYRYLHEHADVTPQITIDAFVMGSGFIPKGITIDTEGAEIRVLQGAEWTLKEYRPIVWASLHAGAVNSDLIHAPNIAVHEFMSRQAYTGVHLASDHEEHWLYLPRTEKEARP